MAKGRKSALTPKVHVYLVKALQAGVDKYIACRAAGVKPATFYQWLRKGAKLLKDKELEPTDILMDDNSLDPEIAILFEEDERKYVHFYAEVSKAPAQGEMYLVGQLQKAIQDGDTRLAQWFLERRFPKRWGHRQQIAHTGGDMNNPSDDATGAIEFVLKAPPLPGEVAEELGEGDEPNELYRAPTKQLPETTNGTEVHDEPE